VALPQLAVNNTVSGVINAPPQRPFIETIIVINERGKDRN
jgi:hypothetical protein